MDPRAGRDGCGNLAPPPPPGFDPWTIQSFHALLPKPEPARSQPDKGTALDVKSGAHTMTSPSNVWAIEPQDIGLLWGMLGSRLRTINTK
jgi:hypothetical protein